MLLGAIAQQQRRALPVDDPMRAHWSVGRRQFLGHDMAFEHAVLAANIALGPSHADVAAGIDTCNPRDGPQEVARASSRRFDRPDEFVPAASRPPSIAPPRGRAARWGRQPGLPP
jgi:hypothetical protein